MSKGREIVREVFHGVGKLVDIPGLVPYWGRRAPVLCGLAACTTLQAAEERWRIRRYESRSQTTEKDAGLYARVTYEFFLDHPDLVTLAVERVGLGDWPYIDQWLGLLLDIVGRKEERQSREFELLCRLVTIPAPARLAVGRIRGLQYAVDGANRCAKEANDELAFVRQWAASRGITLPTIAEQLNVPLKEILPTQAVNLLKRAGCSTLGDVYAQFSRVDELFQIRNFGTGSVRKIQRALADRGVPPILDLSPSRAR